MKIIFGNFKSGEIAEVVEKETGVNKNTVNRALRRLAQAGKIRKSKKGYYEIRREQ